MLVRLMRERSDFAASSVCLAICLRACGGLGLVACGAVGLVACGAVGLVACGGQAPAPQAPALARSSAPAPAPPPDLSPVPDPPALVLSARIVRPGASLATVHAWSKLPMPQAEQVTELVTGEALGPLVDLDQPIDVAVALGGSSARAMQPMAAVSVALKDAEAARALLSEHFKLVPAENGVSLIQGLGRAPRKEKDDADDEDDNGGGEGGERVCELAPAFGAAPVRLICGWHPRALVELGPWLTRTATRSPTKSDLHVDLRMQPVRPIILEQKRFLGVLLGGVLGARPGASGEREVASSIAGDVADFASDLDSAALDMTLGDAGANASLLLKLAGNASAAGRVVTAHPERTGPAPATFWQLPADADFAFFQRGTDEAEIARVRDLVIKAAGGVLGDQGFKEADRKAVLDALAKVASSAPMAYASGLDVAAARKALAAEKAAASRPESERAEARRVAAETLLGWRVLEVDEPATRATGILKELAAAWARPGVSAAYRAKNDGPAPVLRAIPVAKGASLPAGSVHYAIEVHPFDGAEGGKARSEEKDKPKKAPGPTKPVAVHLLVVPDGARTWIGVAGDEALAIAKLAAALKPAGASPAQGDASLSSRAELAALKAGPVGSAGFFTLRGLAEMATLSAVLSGGSLGGVTEGLDEAAQMPGQGLVAIPFSVTAQAGGPPAATLAALQVPRGAIEDVVAAVLRHGGF
jgi:hypothetical protein